MELSLLFLKRYQRHISNAAFAECLKCNAIHGDVHSLKMSCFRAALKHIRHALKCQQHYMRWLDITSQGAIIVNNIGNGNGSSIRIWHRRTSFSLLQLVIFSAVIKMFNPDITSIFEFTDSFMCPTLCYIKFLYNFRLHVAILFLLGEKTKEPAVRPLAWRWLDSSAWHHSVTDLSDEFGQVTQGVSISYLYIKVKLL